MYPRLKLARNLLREDGAIFVSIDDGEVANLRQILDEIFGSENFVANVIWQKKYAVSSDAKGIPPLHDHILVYQKARHSSPTCFHEQRSRTQFTRIPTTTRVACGGRTT